MQAGRLLKGSVKGIFCVASRYGGISVGAQLPVLGVEPKTIQDVAGQLGRLLNVTGVSL